MCDKLLDTFIGNMEMPCYDKCKTFYYYDVLEALCRHLFQIRVDYQKEKLERELGYDKESSDEDENSKSQDFETTKENEEEDELDEREQEDRDDILNGSLQEILYKLETKGNKNNDIAKYKEMREWRQKRDKNVRDHLEMYEEYDGKDGQKSKKSIIDSS